MKAHLLAALCLVGCAGSVQQTTYYLLPVEIPTGGYRVEQTHRIGLGRVAVAPYLGQTGLVIEVAPRQVRPANFHHWAEPLEAGLHGFLRAEISRALGMEVGSGAARRDWDYRVDVDVDRLHGDLSGEARLVASWRIRPGDGDEDEVHHLSASQPLASDGYSGLVEAEIDLARRLAEAIAASLRVALAPSAPAE